MARINELIQVGTDRTESVMPILDADGNETGEYETIVRETPIMQMVYRDMTEDEIAEAEALAASMPEPEPTVEERIAALEARLDALTQYQGLTVREVGNGVYEVVKQTSSDGTEQSPIVIDAFPFEVKPNTFYSYDGKTYVYMGTAGTVSGIDDAWAEW